MGARRPQKAEPGRTYPAWRDGRRITEKGPTLHAVTDRPAGDPHHSGFLSLCGISLRFKVEDAFDPDDANSCLLCAVAVIAADA